MEVKKLSGQHRSTPLSGRAHGVVAYDRNAVRHYDEESFEGGTRPRVRA
jgi:hypothetical protein